MRVRTRLIACLFAAGAAAAGRAVISADGRPEALVITHGIASGDVTTTSAVIWARASARAQMHVEIDTDKAFSHPKSRGSADALEATDFTAHLTVDGLQPATRYWYRVWLSGAGGTGRSNVGTSQVGTFVTAPTASDSRRVSFAIAADIGGQRYCRNAATGGYAIFGAMERVAPDFAIFNGDAIYADGDCPAAGPEPGWVNIPGDFPSIADPTIDWTNVPLVRDVYLKHWRYNRADPYTQSFLRNTSMIAQWDDHEVINDFGAPWTYWNSANINRAGYPNIVAAGLETFFDYSAIARNPMDRDRIYRSFRWGKDLEVFVLDARSYRDRNDAIDLAGETFDPAIPRKIMLGQDQIDWLVHGIQQSTATWKVVSSDVPISIPTGSLTFGRDAWGRLRSDPPTGFRSELLYLFYRLDQINATNVVFVATDVHYATNLAYSVDEDGDGDLLTLHEVVRGPLNAVKNPPKTAAQLDPSAHPTVLYAEGNFFNFGVVTVQRHESDGKVHLVADVRDEHGLQRPGSVLDLTPQ
jgi:alkaline phosphatase D